MANIKEADLLGSPLEDASSVDACVSGKIELLELMGDRLYNLQSHDFITLLRYSSALPKMLHVLRTSPCFNSPRLEDYHALLCSIFSNITNLKFEDNHPSWVQATLPVRRGGGGLGVRSAAHLASPTFLASADGLVALVHQILPLMLHNTPYQKKVEACRQWGAGLDVPPSTPPASFRHKGWDAPSVQESAASLLSTASDARSRPRLLAVSTKESGAWLKTPPISSMGLRMDDESLRIAIGLRLGCQLCLPRVCAHCGEDVDQYATHGLSCR